MSPRLLAAALAAVLAAAGAGLALVLTHDDAPRYVARFTNARGLVSGTDVRVGGAIAGRVTDVVLADDGSALVRFTVDDDRARPREDAVAAIRPVDLLGDNYLALTPGHAARPLAGAISTARTSNAPRLDELLGTFRRPVRDALGTLLVEGGLALDRRGPDLAAASVALRPAIAAADRVAQELDGQSDAIGRAVTSADRALGDLAGRSADVRPVLGGLRRTLAATAERPDALDAGLQGLPATLGRLRGTAARLDATARAATPLAADLRTTAAPLAAAATDLPPLLRRIPSASRDLRPTLRAATQLLTRGAPTIRTLQRSIGKVRATAPKASALVDALVPAIGPITDGFLVNFPDEAMEPGNQPGDPFADPRRAYWRGAAVFSCEAFGVPVKPGCLQDVLKAFAPATKTKRKSAPAEKAAPAPAPASPAPGTSVAVAAGRPVKTITDAVKGVVGAATAPVTGGSPTQVGDLLDFLLKP